MATGEVTTSGTQNVPQLPNHKVKIKKAGQRACNEKDEKGKFCGGHLKRWFYSDRRSGAGVRDAEKAWGRTRKSIAAKTARPCTCRILPRRRSTWQGKGMISVFGLTLPPKEK